MTLFVLAAIVLLIVVLVRQSALNDTLKRVRRDLRDVEAVTRNDFYQSLGRDSRTRRDLFRHEVQFGLLVDGLGMKFVPEKTEEVHQGDVHEVKQTPAKFVKSRSR